MKRGSGNGKRTESGKCICSWLKRNNKQIMLFKSFWVFLLQRKNNIMLVAQKLSNDDSP